ncbi:hypothetical protein LMG33818_001850 [Halomonadaceae bacterium LMG 33818]
MNSMTGFARVETHTSQGSLELEVRSINHRYLDLSFHLPSEFSGLEAAFRQFLKEHLHRGKVSVTLKYSHPSSKEALHVNNDRLTELQHAMEVVENRIIGIAQPTSLDILAWPGICTPPTLDTEILENTALQLLEEGTAQLQQARHREGERLTAAIQTRIETLSVIVTDIRQLIPDINQRQRALLESRAEKLGLELDEHRLGSELALLVQRADVSEELDRLSSHIQEMSLQLKSGDAIGRRLDFLSQELNREANTIASKSVVRETTHLAVELKVVIEQVREQIQNIE